MRLLERLFRRGRRPDEAAEPAPPRAARVFISSTFKDMQRERDILTRAVFPRLRERMIREAVSLFEVDLRWGILPEDAQSRQAVRLCLQEVDDCSPLFMGMLGERYGWRPAWDDLGDLEIAGLPSRAEPAPSVTEMEIRRALLLAASPGHRGPQPFFLLRSPRLSHELGMVGDEAEAMASLKRAVRAYAPELVVEYDDFEAFESHAERRLERALLEWRQIPATDVNVTGLRPLHQPRLMQTLVRAGERSRPVILSGPPGSGISTLGRRWATLASGRGVFVDARALSGPGLAYELAQATSRVECGSSHLLHTPTSINEEIDRLVSALKRSERGRLRIFLDHFEEAYTTDSRADLSDLPHSLPDGVEVLVATRSERLIAAARTREFDVISMAGLTPAERADFVHTALGAYGKRLSVEQVQRIADAPFSGRIGALALCLEELRRHGQFESLDQRLETLASCASDDELVQDVLNALRSSVPTRFSHVLESVLIALGLSLGGLREEELSRAVVPSGGLPPYVWSALRIGLGRAIQWRSDRVDIASGPVRRFAEAMAARRPDLARQVGAALLDHLASSNRRRWVEEAPRILLATGAASALERHLSDVHRMFELLALGRNYAVGCLGHLNAPARARVCTAWAADMGHSDVATAPGADAWELGHLAAEVGVADAAATLFDIDARCRPNRPARDVLEVLALKSAARPEALAAIARWHVPVLDRQAVRGQDSRATIVHTWMQAATVLGLLAEGLVQEEPGRQAAWCESALACASALGDDGALAQAHLLVGQVQLGHARWKQAAANFELAARYARRCGNARRLIHALERGATAALELRSFRMARTLASESLSLAQQCALFEQECQAFERLIEVERRRACWEAAFRLVEQYLARTQAAGINVERAQACLSSLEA